MSTEHDTLNLKSLRKYQDIRPVAPKAKPVEPAIHPDAAAAARTRIARIKPTDPFIHSTELPAASTADLITNKAALSKRAHGPAVSRPSRKMPSIMQPLLTSAGIFALTLLLFKAPIIISEIQYSLHPQSAQSATPIVTTAAVSAQDTITIPKINVQAPVQYISSMNENDIETALESGTIHYASTALPGQNGNVAIFGHSSNDWWQPGNYKFVFVLLNKLAPGDIVYIDYNSVRYTYQVTGTQVVQPSDMSVLNPTSTPTLSIITCTPPGTSLERLVVTARQISPNPNQDTATTTSSSSNKPGTLPSASPGVSSSLENAWNSFTQSVKALFSGGSASNASNSQSPSPQPSTLSE